MRLFASLPLSQPPTSNPKVGKRLVALDIQGSLRKKFFLCSISATYADKLLHFEVLEHLHSSHWLWVNAMDALMTKSWIK